MRADRVGCKETVVVAEMLSAQDFAAAKDSSSRLAAPANSQFGDND